MSNIINFGGGATNIPTPFKPEGNSYLTFSSPNSFTLAVNDTTKHWDGTLEYFASNKTWTTWDGTSTLSSVDNDGESVLYLRGTGNTKITGLNADDVSNTYRWVLIGSDIACVGNIENLLDYATVESGQHPMMAEACYGDMFYGCTSLTKAPALPATTLAIGCYFGMFQGCTALTQAPALPATTLDTSCYTLMFSGCTALIQAPELPATTLAMGCYGSMFPDCTSLTQAPALPATTLAMGCYSSMFQNCTALIQAPALLATTLANSCYGSMFRGCTSLTKAPALPATTLADYCYVGMFEGCTALTQAPALPADTLANDCYESMFWGCTGLKLSSSKTGEYTQEYRIPTTGTGTTATDALTNMFTTTGGTFTGTPEINTTYYLSSDNMIVRDTDVATLNGYVESMIDAASVQPDWNQNDETAPDYVKNRPFYTCDPVETVIVEESTVAFALDGRAYGANFPTSFNAEYGQTYKVSWDGAAYECTCVEIAGCPVIGNLSISTAGPDTGEPFLIFNESGLKETDWISYTADTSASHTISISGFVQEVVKIDPKYLPDTVATFKPEGKSYLTFSSPNSFTLKVNGATKHWDGTLEYFDSNKTWTTWDGTTTLSSVDNDGEYVLYLRGTGNTQITGVSQIPRFSWVLTGSDIKCVGNIENLLDYATVESGAHPTMATWCYHFMFQNCKSLTQAPELPATTLADYCYSSMFYGCTSLTQAPALPATTLANYCYLNMFNGCKSLTKAPALSATTLTDYCYQDMFGSCTSLTQAPALPATTLAQSCYSNMFNGCKSLTQAPVLTATTLATSCYENMFNGCTSLSQAPVLPATTLAYNCYYRMFYGCTALTQAPSLSATTLADGCYRSMFQGCTSLTQVPSLPATMLATNCYSYMFYGCTGLKLSSSKTDEYTQEYRIPSSGTGTTATDALVDMFTSTGGTFTGALEINTTYYLSTDNMIVRETEVATLNGYVGSMIDVAIGNAIGGSY